jgi:hypothetical protein
MSGISNLHHPSPLATPRRKSSSIKACAMITPSTMMKQPCSFRRAAELDPKMAMAYWGIAEAVGPNYNDPASDALPGAHEVIEKAVSLSGGASGTERDYIQAMATRFPAPAPTAGRLPRSIATPCAN